MNFYRQSARFTAWLAAFALAGCACIARAEGPAPAPEWRVAVVGFIRPAGTATEPIPGARSTELAAARPAGKRGGLRYLSQAEFAALGVDWAAFQAKAAGEVSARLKTLAPEWIKEENGVIDCGILHAEHPGGDITPVILAPDFLKRFTPVFGRKILIAIPERGTIFLFPRLASRYQDYAAWVLALYRQSKNPVSSEVLELSATGLRAIGEYEETGAAKPGDGFSIQPGGM